MSGRRATLRRSFNCDHFSSFAVFNVRSTSGFMMTNVELTGAARLYRAASSN